MNKNWRSKLWIDDKRDVDIKKDLINQLMENDEYFDELNGDVDVLRLDKHTCTEEYLTRLLHYI